MAFDADIKMMMLAVWIGVDRLTEVRGVFEVQQIVR